MQTMFWKLMLLVCVVSLSAQAELRRRGGGHHGTPKPPSNTSAPAQPTDPNLIGKSEPDKNVVWEYSVALKPGASLEEIRKIKKDLKNKGVKFNWGTADEPVFGIKTYMDVEDIKNISEHVGEVTPSEETANFRFELKKDLSTAQMKALRAALKENRIQIKWAPPLDVPPYLMVKSAVLEIGRLFALPNIGPFLEKVEPEK
ncbi:hypothetical protein EBR78_02170 [bacterium]|nr:hypothetical protein [bacterium]NBX83016.1 hypothetical protein [bacterium]